MVEYTRKTHRKPIHDSNGREPEIPGFSWDTFNATLSGSLIQKRTALIDKFLNSDMGVSIDYWQKQGVKKQIFDSERDNGRYQFSVFAPLNFKPSFKYPVIYYSHGGGESILASEFMGYSQLVVDNEAIVVYANNGGKSNEAAITEFPRILKFLSTNYAIDEEKVYAVGFSSGSDATESIATHWPELVAGCAMNPGSNAMYNSLVRQGERYYRKNIGIKMPAIFMCGSADYGDRYPFTDEECFQSHNIWMKEIVGVADYKSMTLKKSRELVTETNDTAKKMMGLDFTATQSFNIEDRNWYAGEFFDADGVLAARYMCGQGVPHVVTACQAGLVWHFLQRYRRNLTNHKSVYEDIKR